MKPTKPRPQMADSAVPRVGTTTPVTDPKWKASSNTMTMPVTAKMRTSSWE